MKKLIGSAVLIVTATLATLPVMAQRPLGIDVSSYQGGINWSSVHSDGVKFAYAKATEGTYFQDSTFNNNINNGKAAGVQMGAYDFCRPDLYCPSTEADYFWNKAGWSIVADGKSLYPMADFEVFNGATCGNNYTSWFNNWSSRVKSKTSHFLHPIIYCSAGSGACDLIEYDKAGGIYLSAWIANYNGENLYTGTPWSCCTCCNAWTTGCSGANWTFWQVSSTGAISGISGNVDLDTYALTFNELVSYQGVK
jgi:lysozyme